MSGPVIAAIVVAALVGVLAGLAIGVLQNKRLRIRLKYLKSELSEGQKPPKTETMKLVIWVCLGMGIAWVWCSYLLAWLDHPQIAESLSQVAVTEIIGVVLAYAVKSSIENLSKHNRWPDRGDPAEECSGEEGGGAG